MTNEQSQVKEWMSAFGQETPAAPCIPSLETRKLRAKLILEECLETISALGLTTYANDMGMLADLNEQTTKFSFSECSHTLNLEQILDGCEDLKVVTEGTLVACGLVREEKIILSVDGEVKHERDIDGHFNEVMRSNWSKMWTQEEIEQRFTCVEDTRYLSISHYNEDKTKRNIIVKDSSGKVIKSPSYSPAKFNI